MYQVDKKEVFSVEFYESRISTSYEYLKEVKSFFGKVKFKAGYYFGGKYERSFSNEKVYDKPYVTIKFRNLERHSEYFTFDSDKEALEFFNNITKKDV